jgi:hypothetical protein
VRSDRLARDDAVFRWVVRRAIAEGSTSFRTTYAEAAAGSRYNVPRLNCRANRRRARECRVSTIYRALSSLQAAGLVRFRGLKRADGRWQCLLVQLTPAAYGPEPAFGRSRRRPERRPGRRISFCGRSGTSPEVVTTKNVPESVSVRGRAREGPPQPARRARGAPWAAALLPTEGDSATSGRRPWPNERFDLPDQELVELVEHFEEAFGFPARFSFKRHGPKLRRILDRIDRFHRPGESAGYVQAYELIRLRGRHYRLGNRNVVHMRSFAYLLPVLDQRSKRIRRQWKAENP